MAHNSSLHEYIPIDASLVPYSFEVKLTDRTYTFTLRYNPEGEYYTVDLAISNPSEQLCYGEVLRYGKPLYEQINDERYPLPVIVPLAPDGDHITEITPDNLGSTVKLWLVERST